MMVCMATRKITTQQRAAAASSNDEQQADGAVHVLRQFRLIFNAVKTHFQQLVFDTVIHRNVALGEAPSHGQTIVMHDASSKGAVNYLNLAREILQKNDMTRIKEEERTIPVTEAQ